MKYSVDIVINKPLAEVVEKFDSEENLKHWLKGLKSFELIEGEARKAGAKSKILFDDGKRKMEMIETIVEYKLPDSMTVTYDGPGVHNIVKNIFETIDENSTRVINEQEFQMQSLLMKIFGALMPGMFKKQSMVYLKALKAFVEDGTSVLD